MSPSSPLLDKSPSWLHTSQPEADGDDDPFPSLDAVEEKENDVDIMEGPVVGGGGGFDPGFQWEYEGVGGGSSSGPLREPDQLDHLPGPSSAIDGRVYILRPISSLDARTGIGGRYLPIISINQNQNEDDNDDDKDLYVCPVPSCGKRLKNTPGVITCHNTVFHRLETYSCTLCPKSFSKGGALNDHVRKAHEKPHPCSHCGKRFVSRAKLIRHLPMHTKDKDKPFKCPQCGKGFRLSRYIKRHIQAAHMGGVAKSQCPEPECGKLVVNLKQHLQTTHAVAKGKIPPDEADLDEEEDVKDDVGGPSSVTCHKTVPHKSETYRCTHCPKSFSKRWALNVHVKQSHEKPPPCSHCGKRLSCRENLSRHLRTHTKEKPLKCGQCGKDFRSPEGLKGHIQAAHMGGMARSLCPEPGCGKLVVNLKQHLDAHAVAKDESLKKHVCSICSTRFRTNALLQGHVQRIHRKDEKPFKCTLCPMRFKYNGPLVVHMRRVHGVGEKTQCPICGKLVVNLRFHMRQNHEDPEKRKYLCSHCPKKFVTRTFLRVHEETHTRDPTLVKAQPFKCSYEGCQRAFARRNVLEAHVQRIHLGMEKPPCPKCGKRIANMYQHLKTHQESRKKYLCPSCPKEFLSGRKLREHQIMTHETSQTQEKYDHKKLSCPLCSQWFATPYYLRRHEKTHSSSVETLFRCQEEECLAKRVVFKWRTAYHRHMKGEHDKDPGRKYTWIDCPAEPSCGRKVKNTERGLAVHYSRHHKEKDGSGLACPVCSKVFPTLKRRNRHVRLAHSGKTWICSTCGKVLKNKHALQYHELGHSANPPRPFVCEQCGSSFRSKILLNSHKQTIHEERTVCQTCGKLVANVAKHMKTHVAEEDKNHVCSYCPKRFYLARILENHERTHSGQKPFKCTEEGCDGVAFIQQTSLRNHMKIKHGKVVQFEGQRIVTVSLIK